MISLGKKWLSSILSSPFTVRPRASNARRLPRPTSAQVIEHFESRSLLSAVFTSPASVDVAENTTSVQTVTATGNGTVNFSLVGGADQTKFSITSGGELTFNSAPDFENPTDADSDNIYVVQVQAEDDDGASTQTLSVTITPVNDNNPVFTSAASVNVAENSTAVLTVIATDADLPAQTVTYSLVGGADQSKFDLTSDGVLTFNTAPDFENPADADGDNIYVVQVQADDGNGGTSTQTLSVTVTPVNDNTPAFTSAGSVDVAENTTAVLTVIATDADLPAQTVTFSLVGGADQAKFSITSEGVLTFESAPDFENPTDADGDNIYVVQVQADDGNGGTSTQTLSVTVTPVNDNTPAFTSAGSVNVAENTTAVLTVVATDADLPAQTVTYSLVGGADQSLFGITSDGVLTFNAPPDFENPSDADGDNVFVVQVQADDGNGSTSTQTISITVTPVNDNNPVFTSASAVNVAENMTAVSTVIATDADLPAQTVTYSLVGGADQSLFGITSDGVLTFNSAPDFENPNDADGDNVFVVQVQADDGNGGTSTQTISVTVTPVNDNDPVFTSAASVSVVENTTGVLTVIATDADLPAQTVTYSLVGGADQSSFGISSDGVLTFNSAPDFENPSDADGDNVFVVQVQADDGNGGTSTQTISVTVTPVNDNNPVFTSAASVNVAENTIAVLTVIATDADLPAQTVTYSLVGGADQALFGISSDGVLTFNAAPDFELPGDADGDNVYVVQVQADDGNGGTSTQTIGVTVTDADDNPGFTSAASVNVAENTTAVLTVIATDADLPAQTVTYSLIGGADQGKFGITSDGVLTFSSAPDFENPTDADGDNVYVVQVQADDGNGGTTAQTISVTVTPVNDNNPVFTSAASVNVAENTTAVLTVIATDADLPAQTVTYSLVGGADQAFFSITSDGVLTFIAAPDFENPSDADGDNVYVLQVQADDGSGSTTMQTLSVTVTPVNDNNPVFTSAASVNVAENTTAVLTVIATDADLPAQTVTYSLVGGADQAKFSITSDGVLTFNAAPDFENPTDADGDNVFVVQVQADDGNGGTSTQTISVSVTPVNDNNPVFTSAASVNAAENMTAVLTVIATDADLPAQTVTYSLIGGADQAKFSITSDGVLTFNAAPDFESPADADGDNVYVVQVQADDGNGSTTMQTISVTVTPVNDNNPVFTSAASVNVAENTTAVLTVIATDADVPAQSVTYLLMGGADQAKFSITSDGVLTFNAAPDYEIPGDADGDNIYVVQIQADDGNGGTSTQTLSVSVTDANDNPVFTSAASVNVAENTTAVLTVIATDADLPAQTVTYSLVGGADQAKFNITSDGVLTFVSAPDFENPSDADGDNVFVVQVQADDGNGGTSTQTISVTVTPVNDNNPVFTSAASVNVAENTAAVLTVIATDADLPAQTVTYSLVGGADQAKFGITTDGVLTFNAAPDYELPGDADGDNVYVVRVQADDGNGGTITQTISVTVTDANDNPVFTSASSVNVAENTTAVLTVIATDADLPAQTVTYSLVGGADQALFGITSDGVLTFNAAPDYELPGDADGDNIYVVQVQANDGNGGTSTQALSVTVTDANDSPVFTSAASVNVEENTTAVLTVIATDADLPTQTVTYSLIGGADQAKFSITSEGVLTFIAAPDFENPSDADGDNVFVVQVQADDGNGGTSTQTINVTVTPVNDNTPAFTSAASVNVAENTNAVLTVIATDADLPAQTVTYSLVGGVDQAKFSITSDGVLTFNAAPDYELPGDADGDNIYVVQVQADDGSGRTITQTISVSVTPVNDNSPVFTSAVSVNVSENTTAVLTVVATDADLPAQTVTYSLVGGADQAKFSITSEGVLIFNAAPDFENPADADSDNVFVVQVQADDGNGSTSSQTISVTITPVNDNNPVFTSASSVNVAENTTTILNVIATDADLPAQTVTYSLVGGADQAKFSITSEGVLTFLSAPNYELPGDADGDNVFVVQVQADDGNGGTTTQTISVTVTDANDNPVFTSASSVNVAENTTAVLTVIATDADLPAQTVTYSLVDGADQSKFSITSDGVLTFNAAPDFENPTDADGDNIYVVQVQADDGSGGTSTQTLSVSVTPINDNNPVFTSASSVNVAENMTAVLTVIATDVDLPAQTVTYSLVGGADQSKFSITSDGVLTFVSAPDFESPTDADGDNVFVVQVQADDGNGGTSTQAISVTVTPVNDNNPVFTSAASVNVAENTTAILTVIATDADLPTQAVTYSLVGGADQALFSITSDGVLTFVSAPDFENPSDADGDNIYVVQVQADDGNGGTTTQTISATVTPVNDNNPVFTSAASVNVAENTSAVLTVIATDADLPAQTVTYTLVGGADQALFSITSDGALTFNAAPDYELPGDADGNNVYVVQVQADDGNGGTSTQTLSVTVTPVNDNNPVFTSAALVNVAENTTAVLTVVATDADLPAQTVTYSLVGGADQAKFGITSDGVLTFNSAPDFENPTDADHDNIYVVQVQANDGNSGTSTRTLSVTVTPVNDNNPVFTSAASVNVAENTTAVLTVIATDADLPAQMVTYSIVGGADQAKFSITSGGVLTFNSAPDFENSTDADHDNIYVVQVQANDGNGGTSAQTLNVTVTPVNDNNPVFTSASAVNLAENTTAVLTVIATDADLMAQMVTYSIVGGADQAKFSITSGGVLTFNVAPDFENSTDADHDNIYVVQVQASDGNGGTTTQTISVTVTPVNDNNPVFTSAASVNVAENTAAVLTVIATDADLPTQMVTYSIVGGADQAKFSITSGGVLTFNAAPDFENSTDANHDNVYVVQVQASDGNGGTTTQTISVTVTPVNDNNPVFTSASSVNVVENNTAVLTVIATDADLPTQSLAYSIVGGADQGKFSITSGGVLTFNAAPDFENPTDANHDNVYVVQVQASDDNGNTTMQTISVTVQNVADGVVNVVLPTTGGPFTVWHIGDFLRVLRANNMNLIAPVKFSEVAMIHFIGSTKADTVIVNASMNGYTGDFEFDGGDGNDNLDASKVNFAVTMHGGAGNDTLLGGRGSDEFEGGAGNDMAHGGAGDDTLAGGDGNDVLMGEAGEDSLDGGAGNDRVDGGMGDDTLRGGLDNDTIIGGGTKVDPGMDVWTELVDGAMIVTASGSSGALGRDSRSGIEGILLIGGDGEDSINASVLAMGVTLFGGAGNDTLIGGKGNDVLSGDYGDDELTGGVGDNSLDGGDGSDLVVESADVDFTLSDTALIGLGMDDLSQVEGAILTGGRHNNTLDATAFTLGGVTLNGASGNDTLLGGNSADSLDGGAGNDSVLGNAGDDTLTGGAGNDMLDGGDDSDVLSEAGNVNMTLADGTLSGMGTDTLVSMEAAVLTGGRSANRLSVTTFLGAVTLTGGGGNDSLVGGTEGDLLDGGDGNDTLVGREGDDILVGGNGTDLVVESDATEFVLTDTSLVGVGTDMLSEVELAKLTTADGDSSIDAQEFGGTTTLIGGAGNDTILGGVGIDSMSGGDGDDVLLGNDGNDSIVGGAGNDILLGGAGNDSLGGSGKLSDDKATDGDDTILGGGGKDRIFGGVGDDVLSGEDGNDTLIGGAGIDMLFGGSGADSPTHVADVDVLSPDGVFADASFFSHLNGLLSDFS